MRKVYLFIVWAKGRKFEEKIRADLASKFTILKEYEIRWPWYHAIHNFTFFYRHIAFFSWLRKCWICGTGPFRVIMIEDQDPTPLKPAQENKKMVETKHMYRRWAGKRWRVHSSTTLPETRYQLWLLAGKTLEQFLAEKLDGSCETIVLKKPLKFDLGLLA